MDLQILKCTKTSGKTNVQTPAFGPELCTKQKPCILGSLHNDE